MKKTLKRCKCGKALKGEFLELGSCAECCAKTHDGEQKPVINQTCNLCGRKFKADSKFVRFCLNCRTRSDIYRFAGDYQ
jgi:hypothetical protein